MNSYALPLLEHGQTIWGAITTVYDFIKTISSAKEEGKSVSIENVGDGSIAVAVSDSSSVGDITINNYLYPEYVRELSPKLAPLSPNWFILLMKILMKSHLILVTVGASRLVRKI